MVKLEEVKRNHNCYGCEKRLDSKGSLRVNFGGHNYCISCGYFEIEKDVKELQNFMYMLKNKFGKELVVARLER